MKRIHLKLKRIILGTITNYFLFPNRPLKKKNPSFTTQFMGALEAKTNACGFVAAA